MSGFIRAPAVVLVLAVLAPFGQAAAAQEFSVEDVASVAALPIEQMKPKTILFSDHRIEDLAARDAGLIRFEDWEQARPLEKQLLNLYPGYVEPMVTSTRNGVTRRHKEKLHLYVAQARFVLDKPMASFDLARYATLPFLERIDPSIKHQAIAAGDTTAAKEGDQFSNRNPDRQWCDPQAVVICLRSRYKLEGKLPTGIMLANKLRESEKKIADYLEFESEAGVLPARSIDQAGLAKLTGIDAPIGGALAQNIFYVNQVMQFGRFLALLQPHPKDPNKTVATAFVVLAIKADIFDKRKELERVPVLRNLIPAQVLMGNSSFNTGDSISAGLPNYARNRIRAIASMLASP